ncbi:MAG TPA: NAD(P)H-dependent oxidoreductase [Erysipelothrix sp.]
MNTLIVYTHPWEGSFNHHVLETSKHVLETKGHQVDVIDLHADGFDPIYHSHELKLFSQGKYLDPLAEDYARRLKNADNVVFIFPIWWYGPPAILKGFFDKVFLNGHTYQQNDKGEMKGILNIKKAVAITTAHIEKIPLTEFLGNPIETLYLDGIMKLCGAQSTQWLHCGNVHLPDAREKFINDIKTSL